MPKRRQRRKKKGHGSLVAVLLVTVMVLTLFGTGILVVKVSAPTHVTMSLLDDIICATDPSNCNTSADVSASTTHVADTWQTWTDADTNQVILDNSGGGESPVQIQFLPFQQVSSGPPPTRAFQVNIPVTLLTTLPQGPLVSQLGTIGLGACAVLNSGLPGTTAGLSYPLCAVTILQYSVTVTVSVNDQVVSVIQPNILGDAFFASFQDTPGTTKYKSVYVWLQGTQAPGSNYADVRGPVSQYASTSFTVKIGISEHWKAFYVQYAAISPMAFGYGLANYLLSPTNTVDVDNLATGPSWFYFTATSGYNALPTGIFTTFTAPTRNIQTDTNGNPVIVVSATVKSTCASGFCAGFSESGYTKTIPVNTITPNLSNILSGLSSGLSSSSCSVVLYTMLWLCTNYTVLGLTLPLISWLVIGIILFLMLMYILVKIRRKNSQSERSQGEGKGFAININFGSQD